MHFDVRTAALDDLIEHHVRLAVSLLGAHHLHARLGPWDGTRCDLLIASADDAYGMQALRLACRRGTAVIALGRGAGIGGLPLVDPSATALVLTRHIRDRLQHLPSGRGVAANVVSLSAVSQQPLLCRLAAPPLRGKTVDVQCDGHAVRLRPQAGRAYAASLSELLVTGEKFCSADCRIAISTDDHDCARYKASASLESFLLRVAHRMGEQLPDFPDGHYRLDGWPDFGALPSLVGALRVSRLLIGNTRSLGELAASGGGDVSPVELNTCLWAFAASDLLRDAGVVEGAVVAQVRAVPVQQGLLSSLARRFGLLRG